MSDPFAQTDSIAQTAPAAARNRGPILAELQARLPRPGRLLEVASGTGEHATWFAPDLPDVVWQPTELEPGRLASIAAWRETAPSPNLLPPLRLDAGAPDTWPEGPFDGVLAINLIHIAPDPVTTGLLAGAARVLRPGGVLVLYGPFRVRGAHTAPSNAAFDADLQARDPAWGVRDLDDVVARAAASGLALADDVAMPANNRLVLFSRT